jgi:16S rRNA (guanine527-N7)-methyltransferase
MLDTLKQDARTYDVTLSEAQLDQFQRYLSLLTAWSARVNLVGDVDPDIVRQRHFLESVAVGAALRERQILRPAADVLDVGAGAGFPGVVLKIVWPSLRLTLLEATAKKTAFLDEVVATLALDHVDVLTGRAEALGNEAALRGRFDLVVARAVAPLPVLLELTLPFVHIGGRVATPKGSRVAAEIAASGHALAVLGGKAFSVPLDVPGPPQTLVIIAKERATPVTYPRRPGIPAKAPL